MPPLALFMLVCGTAIWIEEVCFSSATSMVKSEMAARAFFIAFAFWVGLVRSWSGLDSNDTLTTSLIESGDGPNSLDGIFAVLWSTAAF